MHDMHETMPDLGAWHARRSCTAGPRWRRPAALRWACATSCCPTSTPPSGTRPATAARLRGRCSSAGRRTQPRAMWTTSGSWATLSSSLLWSMRCAAVKLTFSASPFTQGEDQELNDAKAAYPFEGGISASESYICVSSCARPTALNDPSLTVSRRLNQPWCPHHGFVLRLTLTHKQGSARWPVTQTAAGLHWQMVRRGFLVSNTAKPTANRVVRSCP